MSDGISGVGAGQNINNQPKVKNGAGGGANSTDSSYSFNTNTNSGGLDSIDFSGMSKGMDGGIKDTQKKLDTVNKAISKWGDTTQEDFNAKFRNKTNKYGLEQNKANLNAAGEGAKTAGTNLNSQVGELKGQIDNAREVSAKQAAEMQQSVDELNSTAVESEEAAEGVEEQTNEEVTTAEENEETLQTNSETVKSAYEEKHGQLEKAATEARATANEYKQDAIDFEKVIVGDQKKTVSDLQVQLDKMDKNDPKYAETETKLNQEKEFLAKFEEQLIEAKDRADKAEKAAVKAEDDFAKFDAKGKTDVSEAEKAADAAATSTKQTKAYAKQAVKDAKQDAKDLKAQLAEANKNLKAALKNKDDVEAQASAIEGKFSAAENLANTAIERGDRALVLANGVIETPTEVTTDASSELTTIGGQPTVDEPVEVQQAPQADAAPTTPKPDLADSMKKYTDSQTALTAARRAGDNNYSAKATQQNLAQFVKDSIACLGDNPTPEEIAAAETALAKADIALKPGYNNAQWQDSIRDDVATLRQAIADAKNPKPASTDSGVSNDTPADEKPVGQPAPQPEPQQEQKNVGGNVSSVIESAGIIAGAAGVTGVAAAGVAAAAQQKTSANETPKETEQKSVENNAASAIAAGAAAGAATGVAAAAQQQPAEEASDAEGQMKTYNDDVSTMIQRLKGADASGDNTQLMDDAASLAFEIGDIIQNNPDNLSESQINELANIHHNLVSSYGDLQKNIEKTPDSASASNLTTGTIVLNGGNAAGKSLEISYQIGNDGQITHASDSASYNSYHSPMVNEYLQNYNHNSGTGTGSTSLDRKQIAVMESVYNAIISKESKGESLTPEEVKFKDTFKDQLKSKFNIDYDGLQLKISNQRIEATESQKVFGEQYRTFESQVGQAIEDVNNATFGHRTAAKRNANKLLEQLNKYKESLLYKFHSSLEEDVRDIYGDQFDSINKLITTLSMALK